MFNHKKTFTSKTDRRKAIRVSRYVFFLQGLPCVCLKVCCSFPCLLMVLYKHSRSISVVRLFVMFTVKTLEKTRGWARPVSRSSIHSSLLGHREAWRPHHPGGWYSNSRCLLRITVPYECSAPCAGVRLTQSQERARVHSLTGFIWETDGYISSLRKVQHEFLQIVAVYSLMVPVCSRVTTEKIEPELRIALCS